MTLILCVDNHGGMLFHGRRQSRDRMLQEDLLQETAGGRLWMNAYSAGQFPPSARILVSESPLTQAESPDFCFVENLAVQPFLKQANRLILYCWNRVYPADAVIFRSPGPAWTLLRQSEFSGSSHEKITKEFYVR